MNQHSYIRFKLFSFLQTNPIKLPTINSSCNSWIYNYINNILSAYIIF